MDVPVVVDLWAPWCGPCRTLGPIIERVIDATDGEVALVKVNGDENPGITQAFQQVVGQQGIPLVIAFKEGRPVDAFLGAVPEGEVQRFVDRLLPTAGGERDRRPARCRRRVEPAPGALDLEPGNEDAIVALGEILVERGDGEEALALLERIPESERTRKVAAAARLGTVPDDDHDATLDGAAAEGEDRRRGPPGVRRHPRADGSRRPADRRLPPQAHRPAVLSSCPSESARSGGFCRTVRGSAPSGSRARTPPVVSPAPTSPSDRRATRARLEEVPWPTRSTRSIGCAGWPAERPTSAVRTRPIRSWAGAPAPGHPVTGGCTTASSRGLAWFGVRRLLAVMVTTIAVVAGGWWLLRAPAAPTEAGLPFVGAPPRRCRPSTAADPGRRRPRPVTSVVVHVAGAVVGPGVYELAGRARTGDAVDVAGGPAPDADLDALNLAAPLRDGERVYVPAVGEAVVTPPGRRRRTARSRRVPSTSTGRRRASSTRSLASARRRRRRSSTTATPTGRSRPSTTSSRCAASARRSWRRSARW